MVEGLLPADMANFHFIRPWCLLLLLLAPLLAWGINHLRQRQTEWFQFIDRELLAPLLSGKINKPGKWLPLGLTLFWMLGALAMAGPTWKQLPQAVEKLDNALVILLDLSPSMLARDVKPARLISARHKIIDLLKARTEGNTALIAYSGDAHVVAPLTNDNRTIINLVNVLEPAIMPVMGSNTEHAISLALQLFSNAGYQQGDILLITDGVTDTAVKNSADLLQNTSFRLSIIGVGTEEGGPIPAVGGGFLKDESGNIIMPALESRLLKKLARQTSGFYTSIKLGDADIKPLIEGRLAREQQSSSKVEREFDQWQDMGAWLCYPLLLLLLTAFRRGLVVSIFVNAIFPLLIISSMLGTNTSYADSVSGQISVDDSWWDKLWLNRDQRAMKAMENNSFDKASAEFNDPEWKASAQYQQGDYQSALEHFQNDNSAKGRYNQGNALAKSGELESALKAYNQAIKELSSANNPEDNTHLENAEYNKELIEKLLQEQQQQQQQNKSDQQQNGQQNDQQQESKQNQQQNSQGQNDPSQQNQDQSSDQNEEQNGETGNDSDQNKEDSEDSDQKDNEGDIEDERDKNNDKNSEGKKDQQQSEESERDSTQQQPSNPDGETADGQQSESEQALEQWLRKVPDDPSALLKNKFEYYHRQQLLQQRHGEQAPHLNQEERL